MLRRLAAAAMVVACLLLVGTAITPDSVMAPEPVRPPSGPELWESLPPELLADVIESKREQISDLRDDIAQIQAIRENKLSVVRPPPET